MRPRPRWPRRSVPAEPSRQLDVEGVEGDVADLLDQLGGAGSRPRSRADDRATPGTRPCRARSSARASAHRAGLVFGRGRRCRGAYRRADGPGDALGGTAGAASALVDISLTGPLLSSRMGVIAQAIADRQNEIDRLQAEIEIKALTDVEDLPPI